MRILLLPASYAPVVGGLQTVVQTLARSFKRQGHDVRVVTNRYPVSLPPGENMDGVEIDRLLFLSPNLDYLRQKRLDLFLASFYFYPKNNWRLKRIISRFRPEVVNIHFPDAQVPFVLKLRRQFDFRLVVSLHGYDVQRVINEQSSLNGTMRGSSQSVRAFRNLRAILREADAVTACSRDLLNTAAEIEPSALKKGEVIYNGIDPARFEEKESYPHPRPYVLALGRLTHNKGFDMLLEAFSRHQAIQGKADLIIAGHGEELETLKAKVEQLGLTRSVHFFGQASSPEVVRLLNGSLSVVVPSRTEAFGIVALEALAAGKPVLATKTGGLEEFLVDLNTAGAVNGSRTASQAHGTPRILLVERTVDGLARGLKEIFELPRNEAVTLNGYSLPDRYTWAHVARSYENVLLGGTQ